MYSSSDYQTIPESIFSASLSVFTSTLRTVCMFQVSSLKSSLTQHGTESYPGTTLLWQIYGPSWYESAVPTHLNWSEIRWLWDCWGYEHWVVTCNTTENRWIYCGCTGMDEYWLYYNRGVKLMVCGPLQGPFWPMELIYEMQKLHWQLQLRIWKYFLLKYWQ